MWPSQLLDTHDFTGSSSMSNSWLKVGLFSLLLSGFFSGVIVFARAPFLSELISDPQFARKSLVLHVVMALVVWFYAFLAAMYYFLYGYINNFYSKSAIGISISGLVLMSVSIFISSAEPVLANYIPVLNHPVFLLGLTLFGLGLCITFLPASSKPALIFRDSISEYKNATQSIFGAGITLIIAAATIYISWVITSPHHNTQMYYELIMWGGGHILQFANVMGMITVWLILLKKITGTELLSQKNNALLLSVLIIPAALSPILLLQGTGSQLYYSGFTQLMRWFIFPVVLIYIYLGYSLIIKNRKSQGKTESLLRNMYFNGFMVSTLLTLTGFILGAMIRSSTTLIPAHYHASLGGVTAAYMVMVFIMLHKNGYKLKSPKADKLLSMQPFLFGVGQFIFVVGFAYAGMYGMGRKLFGEDQNIYSLEVLSGLAAMSIGGLMAIAGGLLFIYIVIASYLQTKQ